jgi:hypothetical protein
MRVGTKLNNCGARLEKGGMMRVTMRITENWWEIREERMSDVEGEAGNDNIVEQQENVDGQDNVVLVAGNEESERVEDGSSRQQQATRGPRRGGIKGNR